MELRDREALAEGFEERADERLRARRYRLRFFLQGLSILSALLCSTVVLILAGGLAEARAIVGTVTPPIVAGPPTLPEVMPGFDAEALQERLEEIAEGYEGVYGVVALEPVSGTKVSLLGDEEFMAASIGKLPPFVALYRAAARGELDLEEEIYILPEDVQDHGFGGLNYFPTGHSLSLRECAYHLVNHSDNTAWAMLERRLGEEKVRTELRDAGIENSRYLDDLSGYLTTPNEVLLLLEKISNPRFTSEKLSAEMLDAMTQTVFEDRIPEKLPSDVRVAHKTGSYENSFGDAGIVFYKDSQGVEKRYYLLVLAKDTGEYEARDVIQEMSLAVYEAVTGTTVDPGWSRGGSVPPESAAADPPAGPSLAENTQAPGGSVEPASSLPAEKPLTQEPPSENRQNAVPDPRFAIPALSRNSATREPAKPVPPPYPVAQEPAYWEKSVYWDEW
ncbi:MAG: class A beta-lactamase-related serine hydrolase [Actinomycetota bacterium]|nr:class A beta-lactamase-related serine hydrolase [Actinomycetota bacterium]